MRIIPEYNRDLLVKYDRQLPRYTSYPTALQFDPDFSQAVWDSAIEAATQESDGKFSLYCHIPFCRSPCFYCACNRIITRDRSRTAPYLKAMIDEMALVAARLPATRRAVSQVHLGGGTPTFLDEQQLLHLWSQINALFDLDQDGEYSIEVDPRASSVDLIEKLALMGFNRLSFGIQDLDADVQKAVNRIQSEEETFGQIAAARSAGIKSVNVDLIYGLPRQDKNSFGATIDRVIDARPNRVAVYAYAHMPALFKAQTQIDRHALPCLSEKLELLELAIDKFHRAGYDYIGLDHFALPDDELARARRDNSLQRNFQGYATQKECDMLGFGVTSIGKIGDIYYQNSKTEADYLAILAQGRLPIVKGYCCNPDDRIRKQVIMALMCQGELDFANFQHSSGRTFFDYFSDVRQELSKMEADGLLWIDASGLRISPVGQLLLRNIANLFDAYRKPSPVTTRPAIPAGA